MQLKVLMNKFKNFKEQINKKPINQQKISRTAYLPLKNGKNHTRMRDTNIELK